MSERSHVVVVGGGLAGLAAAIGAADAGWRVTLLESRPRLGGATHSFTRRLGAGGDPIAVDNGQHVFLRCCTQYRAFLDRLGVGGDTFLQPRLDVPVIDPVTRRRAALRRDPLPAPLHLARALVRYGVLSPLDRIRAIRGALALRGVDRDAAASDRRTLGDWLRAHGQNDATIERLFDVFTVATLNVPAAQASLRLGAMVFQDGLLRDASACDIGYARVPLGDLHGDAGHAALVAAGADVRLGSRVRDVRPDGDRWVVHTSGGTAGADVVGADAVVLATPHDVTARLLPPGAVGDDTARALAALEFSPILNVHVVFDRVVMTDPFVAAVDSPAQFVFDRTHASHLASGQYLAVSVSAADRWIDEPVARLREVFVPELGRILPQSRAARVVDFFVTRERHATFRPAPGSAAARMPARTALPGLLVAGAWTDTGWPATMEGAVRSGLTAAGALGIPSIALRLTGHNVGSGGSTRQPRPQPQPQDRRTDEQGSETDQQGSDTEPQGSDTDEEALA
jgi:squalene-associated FAD-dependent desaturase